LFIFGLLHDAVRFRNVNARPPREPARRREATMAKKSKKDKKKDKKNKKKK
jgi:hypothetical protein